MSLDGVLGQASSGLDNIGRRLSVVSQNVANATTPDYVRETIASQSVDVEGIAMGVRTGAASRAIDKTLQGDLLAVDGRVSDSLARQDALAGIDAASGTPGGGQDLASLVGGLRDAFSTLANDPGTASQQSAVVRQAATLAGGLNALAATVSATRQTMQDRLGDDVTAANTALRTVGQLSNQIVATRARGESTAALEDHRDTAMRTVTELTGAKFLTQDNGDVLAVSGGTLLATHAQTGPLAIATATLAPGTPASAVPAIMIDGKPAAIAGGKIGAELDLRDTVLPGLQATLDGFAQGLASAFSAQGLDLFTDGAGAVPASVAPGFAQVIRVNPAVQATPGMVRDGAAPAGAAGDTALIQAVLGKVLNAGPGTLSGQASDIVAHHAGIASGAATQLANDQAVQTSLAAKLSAGTSVSVDSEMATMVQLQNSYGANAKVIAAVQTIWNQLLSAVQ